MVEANLRVLDPAGLHARPAAKLVQEAIKFECELVMQYGARTANAKSILQVLALGVNSGELVRVWADGPGEEEALSMLSSLFKAGNI